MVIMDQFSKKTFIYNSQPFFCHQVAKKLHHIKTIQWGNQHKEHKEHEWIVICFCQFLTNRKNLYTLNKSFSIIVEKLGCQNCVIVHTGNVFMIWV